MLIHIRDCVIHPLASKLFSFCVFVQTDGLVWVVDSADKRRLQDCKKELHSLINQEVSDTVGAGS